MRKLSEDEAQALLKNATLSDRVVAVELGKSRESVRDMRRRLGVRSEAALGAPRKGGALWNEAPFDRDPETQAFVREHPGGATLEQVAQMVGMTRERIRQIETAALRKLRQECGELLPPGTPPEAFPYYENELERAIEESEECV